MKISVIVVSYNEAGYLAECLDSCLRNLRAFPKPGDCEIIIGDDGSNDGSQEIIWAYQEKYPDLIRSFVMERNITGNFVPSFRVSNLIKQAIGLSRGQYLQIISGDDLLLGEDKLARAAAFLDGNPGYASCHSDFTLFWDDGKEVAAIGNGHDFSPEILWCYVYKHISCYVFRREVSKNLLERFCDDDGMYFSCFLTGKTKHVGGVDFGYRQRATGIMGSLNQTTNWLTHTLLSEDALRTGRYRSATYARMCVPILVLFRERNTLNQTEKGRFLSAQSRIVTEQILKYDTMPLLGKLRFLAFLACLGWWKVFYKVRFEIEKITR